MSKRLDWRGYDVEISEREDETSITFSMNGSVEGQYSFKDSYEFIYSYLTTSRLQEMVGNTQILFYQFKMQTGISEDLTEKDFEACVKELTEKYTVIKHSDLDDMYDNNYKISDFMLALYNGNLLTYAEKVISDMHETQGRPWTIDEVNYSGNVRQLMLRFVEYSCNHSNEYLDAFEVVKAEAHDYCAKNLESLVDAGIEYLIFGYDSIDKRGEIREVHSISPDTVIIETEINGGRRYFPMAQTGDYKYFKSIEQCLLYSMFGPKHYESVLCLYNNASCDV